MYFYDKKIFIPESKVKIETPHQVRGDKRDMG